MIDLDILANNKNKAFYSKSGYYLWKFYDFYFTVIVEKLLLTVGCFWHYSKIVLVNLCLHEKAASSHFIFR